MFRLLKWEAQFVLALVRLGFRCGMWLVRLPFRSRAQPAAAPQPAPQAAPSVPSASPPLPPTIHVTVNLTPEALARPQPASPPPQASAAMPSAAQVIAHPDHRIYFTSGSDFMAPHPRGADLLERLDHMLYLAAHRHGAPFTIPPALDDSQPVADPAPMPPPLDLGGFDPVTPWVLPPPDGALWLVRTGHEPERVAGS